ncbi:suppressor of cytokine signaling 1-like [Seriola dumerili]|uniref:Suppressor of cytokine signaling 1b n=1 Tax=Seriola dumerili TaxID=41447 RepID=A0A3B4UZ81_SERDU|nr:suppressor of cytokine signaling 1-like [Seriola dumerili]XP_022593765.1 suppressor of cytokine signaling 1-like [Seriola dumerili]XP_022593766.1 suppressor of cytokine signaling 1-like [Seriola dumerili]
MVQQAGKKRILLCRMVRENLEKTGVQSRQQNITAETPSQNQPLEEPGGPEQSPDRVTPDSQEPTEKQLDLLLWSKLNLKEDAETWRRLVTGADAHNWPTHLRPFSSPAEYELVKSTYQQLQHSGYYWGPMTMEEAHEILMHALQGTFLIRDSGQPDVFFTLSYQSEDGPTSVRVQLNNLLFNLHGSQRNFASLFDLLTYYTSSSCKLTVPYRKQRPESLKQVCRRAFIRTYGAENISTLPGLSPQDKNYVCAYPHCI